LSMQVRPNHLGMALARHRRAGGLQEDDGRWSVEGSGEVQAERYGRLVISGGLVHSYFRPLPPKHRP
jgi:hypothetical protein